MDHEEDEFKFEAILQFIGRFPTLSGSPPLKIEDLDDGVALFEILSEIAPEYFNSLTISRSLGNNWALKSSNFRKIIRNMEAFFRNTLRKTTDFSVVDISGITRNADSDAIISLFELIAAAAVLCEHRVEIVGRIMEMSNESQLEMKRVIEAGMGRLQDLSGDANGEQRHDFGESELVFDHNLDDEAELFLGPNSGIDASADDELLLSTVRERDELSKALEEALRELNSRKKDQNFGTLDIELENKRLRDLTADLQERLDIYQNSLHDAELVAAQGKRQLDEVKSEVYALRERIAQLEDELDLAKAKALQLHKAEATVFAYKKKLDSVGVISQQIQEMEDQSTGYLRQIVDLENDNKQIPGLQRKIETMQEQMRKLEMQLSESSKQLNEKNTMILQLRTDLVAAENAKKLFEDEVSAVRSQNSNSLTEDHDASNFTLLRPSTSTANLKERIFRVEHENESLKKQIFLLQAASSTTADDVVSHDIKREIEQRDAKINQLSQDKAKLEAYSKMTLAKFQEKYMVALQECKKQLKEKTEKIEQLEMRAAVEKAGHKREEQLLSSSIYELGLSIMQGNLTRK